MLIGGLYTPRLPSLTTFSRLFASSSPDLIRFVIHRVDQPTFYGNVIASRTDRLVELARRWRRKQTPPESLFPYSN